MKGGCYGKSSDPKSQLFYPQIPNPKKIPLKS